MADFEKLKNLSDELKSYEKDVMVFDRDNPELDFKPAHYPPKEDGMYLTIRCGLMGIKTYVNEWKNGQWQMNILDGSTTIAYSRNTIELKNL